MKKNKILAIVCCVCLAALCCISVFLPKTNKINTASAYAPDNSTSFDTLNPNVAYTANIDDLDMYSSFLSVSHNFTQLADSSFNYKTTITPYFSASNISSDFNSISITPSSDFNYTNFLEDYLNAYSSLCDLDNRKGIYLTLSYYINTTMVPNALNNAFHIYSNSTKEIVKTFNYSNYVNSSRFVYYDYTNNYNTPEALKNCNSVNTMIDLQYIANELGVTLLELFKNYYFEYTFNIYTMFPDLSVVKTYGLSLTQYASNSMISLYQHNAKMLNINNSLSSLGYFYYLLGGNSLNDYYDNFYKNFYEADLTNKLEDSYNNGYNYGYAEGSSDSSSLPSVIVSFASLPFSILGGFLDFDLFGFNIYNLVLALVTLLLCIWLIKKIK